MQHPDRQTDRFVCMSVKRIHTLVQTDGWCHFACGSGARALAGCLGGGCVCAQRDMRCWKTGQRPSDRSIDMMGSLSLARFTLSSRPPTTASHTSQPATPASQPASHRLCMNRPACQQRHCTAGTTDQYRCASVDQPIRSTSIHPSSHRPQQQGTHGRQIRQKGHNRRQGSRSRYAKSVAE
mmetsp:Transcript_45120/g.127369  ORF Transcript_45120/g.127369 Transcript_45120/m.127369 type:complete len:181 (+) Transcript_45120:1184-1726(+)